MSDGDGRLARGSARRRLLLEAAVHIVAGSGSGSLTHRSVASEAGVSVASVTYHFPSIGELRRETLAYAGSSIGLELAYLVTAASEYVDNIPEICAEYAAHLLANRRVETAAVFELIVAAGHDAELRPVVELYNSRLADLLTPYAGKRGLARTLGSAIQGLLLERLAGGGEADATVGQVVADLIRRYRAVPAHAPERDHPGLTN